MASRQSTRTSQQPSVSSTLLNSGSFASGSANLFYGVGQRSTTPTEGIVRQAWYTTLFASFHEQCALIRRSWRGFCSGKVKAILRISCFPCLGLVRALEGHRRYCTAQIGSVYLYLYLCAAVVVNFAVALSRDSAFDNSDRWKDIVLLVQNWFVIGSSVIAIICMWCLFLFACEDADFSDTRGKQLLIFYKGGTYLFGFATFFYTVCVLMDYITCAKVLDSIVMGMKAMFTLSQILFLHYFYEAKIPKETPCIEFVMAHLLGTNLALWFWSLCSEEASETLQHCVNYPLSLDHSKKYFSPFFVEFLLLAASLVYQLWCDLQASEPMQRLSRRHCDTCICHTALNIEDQDPNNTNDTRRKMSTRAMEWRSAGLGMFIGCCFFSLFVFLVVMSSDSGADHQSYHIAYSVGAVIFSLAQISACYIILLSLHSHERNTAGNERPTHEEILLYISLVGILLWKGLHSYSVILNGSDHDSAAVDVVNDLVGILECLMQLTALINLGRHKLRMQHQSNAWICECVFFMLTTNLALWAQDSFFLEIKITTPGEATNHMEKHLKAVAYIIYPLTIFFRFHSAVCYVVLWCADQNETRD